MRQVQLEGWVIEIVDRVLAGHRVEDGRIELKAEMPAAEKAARRLAAHANASGGEAVLWIVGIDEKKRELVRLGEDPAAVWQAIAANFDGVAPDIVHDLRVPLPGGGQVWALYFDTQRAPFVVRAPAGQTVTFEVPFRVGTRVKTADRGELLRILVPRISTPDLEFVGGEARQEATSTQDAVVIRVRVLLYLLPRNNERAVIPTHHINGTISLSPTDTQHTLSRMSLKPPVHVASDSRGANREVSSSPVVDMSISGIVCTGPEMLKAEGLVVVPSDEAIIANHMRVFLTFQVVGVPSTLELSCDLKRLDRSISSAAVFAGGQSSLLQGWR